MSDAVTRLNAALEGRYRVDRQLGEGGMATVYLADDLRHERKVALKVLKPELAAVVGADRFLAEIKTTANLQHPHILPLFDSGEADGFLFYVMPRVEGVSLRGRLDREHQLPVDEAVRITMNVAEALDYAHRQGVIHRDIKPANILLQDGKPVVSDFGIALALGAAGAGRLTETGLSLGTPHYMSPEQATGDMSVGAATDVYALGCVLYEMLVGEPPYTGSTPQAVLGKIVTGDAEPVTKHRRSVPPNVDAAIRRALEKVPADRFGAAADFAAALSDPAFRHDPAGPSGSTRRSAWNRPAWAFAALAALLGAGWALSALGTSQDPERLRRFLLPPPDSMSYAQYRCCATQFALSPDGAWLAFVTDDGALFRRRVDRLEAEAVPGGDDASTPFFSPDGRWLAFWSNGRFLRSPMAGGPPVEIADANLPSGASWGDDGRIVYVLRNGFSVHTVSALGGEPNSVPNEAGETYDLPSVLPGGGRALLVTEGAPDNRRLVVMDLESGAIETVGAGTKAVFASGHLVLSDGNGTVFAQPFDPARAEVTGEAVPLLPEVAVMGTGRGEFAVSQAGDLVYMARGAGSETLVLDGPAGPSDVPLTQGGTFGAPAFSPDGRRVAVLIFDTPERQDIWLWDREQLTEDPFTELGERNMLPVWSPDGRRIAYMSHREGAPGQIYVQPTDGSGGAERLFASDWNQFPGSWSPDGGTLAFSESHGGNSDVGLFTLGETEPKWVLDSEFNERQPEISPDGRWLAYTSSRSGEYQVYVQAIDGGGSRYPVSRGGGHSPRWDPESPVLYYVAGGDATSGTLTAATYAAGDGFQIVDREPLFDLNKTWLLGRSYDVRPNGEEFAYVRRPETDTRRLLVWVLDWPQIAREMTGAR